jgi:hypothetical protein
MRKKIESLDRSNRYDEKHNTESDGENRHDLWENLKEG